jgi:hypothetical protein
VTRHVNIGTIGYMGGLMSLPEPFLWSWGNMLLYSQEALCGADENEVQHIHVEKSKFSLHDVARNDLVRRMQGDWILMFDTDTAFDSDLGARLVATMRRFNLDVVTGIYCYKSPPHYPVLYLYNHASKRNEVVADWHRSAEVFQVDSSGAGALCVRRNVFERIVAELEENPFDRIGAKGEDHSFFQLLRTLQIKTWCAWKAEVQHLEYVGLVPSQHFRPEREPDHIFERETFDLATPA